MNAWICPRCDAVNAPHVAQCPCSTHAQWRPAPIERPITYVPAPITIPTTPIRPWPIYPVYPTVGWTSSSVIEVGD